KVVAWFAESANGIGNFFANRVHTRELCVGDGNGEETCITKGQLDALLESAASGGAAGASGASGGGGGNGGGGGGGSTGGGTPPVEPPVATSTPPVASSTPPVISTSTPPAPPIPGCMDDTALNYNPAATEDDPDSCDYP